MAFLILLLVCFFVGTILAFGGALVEAFVHSWRKDRNGTAAGLIVFGVMLGFLVFALIIATVNA